MIKLEEGKKDFVLTKGSKYRVKSLETREKPLVSHGTFEGYTVIGHDEAIVIFLDDSHKDSAGRKRIIPTHMVLAIDVVEAVEEGKKREDPSRMYI
ncbi:MAG: hypothetical protein JSV43_06735 [Methanobacteriota archaeon]|nr:MAG: hypothetical protein JSV43_06735 [Euryarchaeota archaeon]